MSVRPALVLSHHDSELIECLSVLRRDVERAPLLMKAAAAERLAAGYHTAFTEIFRRLVALEQQLSAAIVARLAALESEASRLVERETGRADG